jgi:hypothetical protein
MVHIKHAVHGNFSHPASAAPHAVFSAAVQGDGGGGGPAATAATATADHSAPRQSWCTIIVRTTTSSSSVRSLRTAECLTVILAQIAHQIWARPNFGTGAHLPAIRKSRRY